MLFIIPAAMHGISDQIFVLILKEEEIDYGENLWMNDVKVSASY